VLLAVISMGGGRSLDARASPPVASSFILHCSGCHGLEGGGIGSRSGVPDFRDSVGFLAGDEGGRTYLLQVPGVGNSGLDAEQVAAVMNYVIRTWGGISLGNDFVPFTAAEVRRRRAYPVADVVRLRRQVVERLRARGMATAPYPWP
jgi:hypothetical protein